MWPLTFRLRSLHAIRLAAFVPPCQQTQRLYQHAVDSSSCDAGADEVELLNDSCCEQDGKYLCAEGTPSACDAQCAGVFIPYWMHCIVADEAADVSDIREFQAMHQACSKELPEKELDHLYGQVVAMVRGLPQIAFREFEILH
jgi:hypothetical protein